MSNWIKVFRTTPFKIEITRIAKQCGCSRGDAFLAWFQFYTWADDETETGHIPMLTADDADSYAGLKGFGAAMISVGWLMVDDTGGHITDFEKHNGSCSKKRSLTAQRVARFAHANAETLVKTEKTNANALAKDEKTNAGSVSKLTQERYLDKNRIDKNICNTNTLCVEPINLDSTPEVSHGSTVKTGCDQAAGKTATPVTGTSEPEKKEPEIDEFKLQADDGKKPTDISDVKIIPLAKQVGWNPVTSSFSGISADILQGWTNAYRAVDIDSEILKAQEWLRSNPTQMKKNLYRFLSGWLGRCQERGRSRFNDNSGSIYGSGRQNATTGNSGGLAIGQRIVYDQQKPDDTMERHRKMLETGEFLL